VYMGTTVSVYFDPRKQRLGLLLPNKDKSSFLWRLYIMLGWM